MQTIYFIIYGRIMNSPQDTARLRFIECFNELFFMILIYCALLMTDLAANVTDNFADLQQNFAQGYLILIMSLFGFNMMLFFKKAVEDCFVCCRRRMKQNAFIKV